MHYQNQKIKSSRYRYLYGTSTHYKSSKLYLEGLTLECTGSWGKRRIEGAQGVLVGWGAVQRGTGVFLETKRRGHFFVAFCLRYLGTNEMRGRNFRAQRQHPIDQPVMVCALDLLKYRAFRHNKTLSHPS